MTKIAVSSRGDLVDEHFGHCKDFLLFNRPQDTPDYPDANPGRYAC